VRFPLTAPALRASRGLALGLLLAATVAACSSSSSTSAAGSGSGSPAVSSGSPAPVGSSAPASSPPASNSSASGATAAITANWEKFFSSSTPVSAKVGLLQNGSTFEAAIKDFANFPLASSLGAKVTSVTVTSSTSATVGYNITTSTGTSLLSGQKGTAVYQNGGWKVGDASLCGLLKLVPGSTAPAACNSVG
jgi:hypothetical protein